MALCPVVCGLLGDGDPQVAHVTLSHMLIEVIEADDDVMAIEAAYYSLGLASEADTHLARLQEFGDKHFIGQRQARYYSDRGLAQLARLIATHWTTRTVPEATVIVIGTGVDHVAVAVQLRRQVHIDMRPARLGLWPVGQDEPTPIAVSWVALEQGEDHWGGEQLAEPLMVSVTTETTVRLVWRGEVWPTFTVVFTGDIGANMVRTQTLGAACAVTLTPATAAPA
jgi:hypothetical protein